MFQKIRSLWNSVPPKELDEVVHTWEGKGSFRLRLMRKGDSLHSIITAPDGYETFVTVPQRPPRTSMDDHIRWLVETHTLATTGMTSYVSGALAEKPEKGVVWPLDGKKIRVSEAAGGLVWELFNRAVKRTTTIQLTHSFDYFVADTQPSIRRLCVSNAPTSQLNQTYGTAPAKYNSSYELLQILAFSTLETIKLDGEFIQTLEFKRPDQVLLRQWDGPTTIRLFKAGNALSYTVQHNNSLHCGSIAPVPELTVDELTLSLVQSQPIWDSSLCKLRFEEVQRICQSELPGNRRISFLVETDQWELVDRIQKFVCLQPFEIAKFYNPMPSSGDKMGYYEKRFHPHCDLWDKDELKQEFVSGGLLKQGFQTLDRLNFVETCSVTKVEVVGNQIHSLTLQPQYVTPSRLDPNQMIDRQMWAITLVNTDAKWYGHAALMVEVIHEEYAMFRAHLHIDGKKSIKPKPGIVAWTHMDLDRGLHIKEKRETWVIPRSRVQKMMDKIQDDIDKQSRGETAVLFSSVGHEASSVKHSKRDKNTGTIVSVENCMTYVRSLLKIAGIELQEMPGALFVTPKAYMKPGSKLKMVLP